MDTEVIDKIENIVAEETTGAKNNYAEIEVIRYVKNLKDFDSVKGKYDIDIQKYVDQINLNMDFLGIDLSQVPTQNWKDIKITHLPMHTTVMHELDLFDYDHVFYLRRLRYADDELLALDQTYIPSKYAPELKAEYFAQNNVSLFHVLQDKIHITPNRAQESFSVCSVSEEDAKDLRVAPRSPALVNTRISYLNGNPIEYNYRICKGESYQYSVNLEMR